MFEKGIKRLAGAYTADMTVDMTVLFSGWCYIVLSLLVMEFSKNKSNAFNASL